MSTAREIPVAVPGMLRPVSSQTPPPSHGVDLPPAEDDGTPGQQTSTRVASRRNRQPKPSDDVREEVGGNPYRGSVLRPMNHRVYAPLAARLAELATQLDTEGYRVSQAELLQAILHFQTPDDSAAARSLVRRWRRLLAD